MVSHGLGNKHVIEQCLLRRAWCEPGEVDLAAADEAAVHRTGARWRRHVSEFCIESGCSGRKRFRRAGGVLSSPCLMSR